jgi:5-methylcytosine-specific restriction endonuclease McrA
VIPIAPERYAIQVTVPKVTHDRLRRAQELLRHRIPDGNVADILDRALELLVRDLEKRKFAVTERPRRPAARASTNPRHVPAGVKRAVYRRDGGQCTFVGENGRRCEARGASLQYDHAQPIARGGTSTTGNLRLRCHAHNQLEAERVLGAEFMHHKRAAARLAGGARNPTDERPASRGHP